MPRPLAELHVHLEGTAPPALIRRLAGRNGIPVPDGIFAGPDRFAWVDFLDFLQTYDRAASVIRTAQDYRDVTYEYLTACAREGAIYVELIASPDHAASVGLPDAEHYGGIAAGHRRRARRDGHRGAHPGGGHPQLRRRGGARRSPAARPRIAIPTSSASTWRATRPATPRRSSPARTRSRRRPGLGCTVHAGEHAGAESVREALTLPGLAPVARGAGDRGPGAGRRARRARDRARGLPHLQRGHRASIRATKPTRCGRCTKPV